MKGFMMVFLNETKIFKSSKNEKMATLEKKK
jgi:hypothetical protein